MPPKKNITNLKKKLKIYGPNGKVFKPKPITAKEVRELYKKLINNNM